MAPRIFVENDLTTMIVLEDVDLMLDTGPAHIVVVSIRIGNRAGSKGCRFGRAERQWAVPGAKKRENRPRIGGIPATVFRA